MRQETAERIVPQFHFVTISYVRTFMAKRFNSFLDSTSSPAVFPCLIIICVVKYLWHLPWYRIWRKSYTKSRLENVMTFVNSFIELSRLICRCLEKNQNIHRTFYWHFDFSYTVFFPTVKEKTICVFIVLMSMFIYFENKYA